MCRSPLHLEGVSDDAPLRLAIAAAMAFPDGSMTVSGLRKEHYRGNLEIELIAGKQYTTLAAIKRMREKCRATRKGPASLIRKPMATGTSATANDDAALAALLRTKAVRN